MATVPPTDAELDQLIQTRLRLLDIDLSVLTPAEQDSAVRAARSVLRGTVPVISAYTADVEEFPPALYPAEQNAWTAEDGR